MARSLFSSPAGRRRARLALLGGVAALAVVAGSLDIETPSLSLPLPGEGSASIGALRIEGGLIATAFAQSGAVTLENVVFEGEGLTLRLPSITFEGTSLGREALREALTGGGGRAFADVLATIDARVVTAPELIVEQELQGISQRVVYSALEARDVVGGVIGRLGIEHTTVDDAEDRSVAIAAGETLVEGLDLPGTVRFYTEGAVPGADNPMRTLYERFSVADLRARDADGVEIRIGELAGSGFRARLLQQPFFDFIEEMGARADGGTPSRDEARAAMRFLLDLTSSVEFGGLVMRDFTTTIPDLGGEVMRITRIGVGPEAGPEGGVSIEAMAIAAESSSVSVERLYSTGFSFAPTLAGLAALVEREDLDLDPATIRALAPTVGRFGLEGLVASIAPEEEDDPIAFALAGMQVVAEGSVGGIPSFVSARIDDLAFAIPKNADEEVARTLLDLGYEAVTLSARFAARWDEPAQALELEELAVAGRDMGSLNVGARLGNIGPELFHEDRQMAMIALLGASAERLRVFVEDEGLAERVLAQQARQQGVPAEVLQQQGAMMATAMLPMMMGNSPQARELGQAIGAFVSRPGILELEIAARDPDGIPLVLLGDLQDPLALLQMVDIAARAR